MTLRLVYNKHGDNDRTISCDSLGWLYYINEDTGCDDYVLTVYRNDTPRLAQAGGSSFPHTEIPNSKGAGSILKQWKSVGAGVTFKAEIRPRWSQRRIRFAKRMEWQPLHTFLHKPHILSRWYIFRGQDGEEYRWIRRDDGPALFKGDRPVVTFRRGSKKKDPSYLEVHEPSLVDIDMLDSIIISLVIVMI